MSNSSEIHISQSAKIKQNIWNSFPANVNSQVSHWEHQQKQNFQNACYQQMPPSFQQAQNQIQTTHQQWSQSDTPVPNATYTKLHHLYQNTQSFQQQMALKNPLHHPLHHQLTPSNRNFQQSVPHAQISLMQTPQGRYKAVVKRNKRKRTMFTTEQLEFLESYFSSKPYVTRDERQVLVKTLNVSDSAVKVWFQNRRIRSKRDQEQSLEEEDSGISTGSSPLLSSSSTSTSDADCSPDLDKILLELSKNRPWEKNDKAEIEEILSGPVKPEPYFNNLSSKLDELELKINQRTDEFGIVHLSEKLITEIVSLVDQFLPQDLDIDGLLRSTNEMIPHDDNHSNQIITSSTLIYNKEKYSNPNTDSVIEKCTKSKSSQSKSDETQTEIIEIIHDGKVQVASIENIGYCYIIDNGVQSGNNSCTVAMYEPISPAESVEETVDLTDKTIPRDKLQEIFNRVFC